MQPGDTITPQQNMPPAPVSAPTPNPQPEQPVVPPPAPIPEQPTVPEPQSNLQPSSAAAPDPESQFALPTKRSDGLQTVSWTASEFIAHQKNGGWYMLLGLAGVVGAAVVYLLTKDLISTSVIVVVMIVLGVFASRKPRTLQYQLNEQGVQIADKFYPYNLFKSFSVIDEGALNSIMLMPLKRFMPSISMYYDPSDEQKIADLLTSYLPYEERDKDMVDKFMSKIRF